MSQVLDDLVALISLEQIEVNLFRGYSQDLGLRQLFGGQVISQSLSAASQTLESERHVHSLHGYFLRPGDASMPILFHVDRMRDGGTFSARRVTAIQKGEPIFTCSASFQTPEKGFEHQISLPYVVGPEGLDSDQELMRKSEHLLAPKVRERLLLDRPFEVRPVDQNEMALADPKPTQPLKYAWIRANGELPDIPALHKYLVAYASDFGMMPTSMLPHGVSGAQPFMQVASIDHAIWFHRDLRADEWLLYALDSPWSGNGRGFSRGSIFNRQGQLVASVAQEGLMRYREDWKT
jgi:acyl-CoA thioesterase-2